MGSARVELVHWFWIKDPCPNIVLVLNTRWRFDGDGRNLYELGHSNWLLYHVLKVKAISKLAHMLHTLVRFWVQPLHLEIYNGILRTGRNARIHQVCGHYHASAILPMIAVDCDYVFWILWKPFMNLHADLEEHKQGWSMPLLIMPLRIMGEPILQ